MGRGAELPTQKSAKKPGAPTRAAFSLRVVEGPDAGLDVVVGPSSPTRVLVGTSPLCDVRLRDAQVSRRHLSLRRTESALEVLDLGSTNGTSINGVRIREATLVGGEAIRIGASVVTVRAVTAPDQPVAGATSFGRMRGESPAMRKVIAVLDQLARVDHPILLEGEAGTGKELAAEEVHHRGRRSEAPFAVLETALLSADEITTRLFAPGGLFATTSGGTLFIDEVGSLPVAAQGELATRLDDPQSPRLVLATKRDLDRDVAAGRFRDDLLDRLASTRVALPALREREGDVRLLAEHFWKELATNDETRPGPLPPDLLPRFVDYPWPGNVRELRHAAESRFRLGELGVVRNAPHRDTSDFLDLVVAQPVPYSTARRAVLSELEKRYVAAVLDRYGGNIAQAAAASGLAPRYFRLIRARVAR